MGIKSVSAARMAEIDRRAREEFGIPQEVLMENAGSAVARHAAADPLVARGAPIAVLCGKGNNGGDGLVAARHLTALTSSEITVFLPPGPSVRPGAPELNLRIVSKIGVPVEDVELFGESDNIFPVVIDALYGTGFTGVLPAWAAGAYRKTERDGSRVYSVDVPSGLDPTSGKAAENCFRARMTITFGLPKKGFYIADGPVHSGEVIVEAIGFPRTLLDG